MESLHPILYHGVMSVEIRLANTKISHKSLWPPCTMWVLQTKQVTVIKLGSDLTSLKLRPNHSLLGIRKYLGQYWLCTLHLSPLWSCTSYLIPTRDHSSVEKMKNFAGVCIHVIYGQQHQNSNLFMSKIHLAQKTSALNPFAWQSAHLSETKPLCSQKNKPVWQTQAWIFLLQIVLDDFVWSQHHYDTNAATHHIILLCLCGEKRFAHFLSWKDCSPIFPVEENFSFFLSLLPSQLSSFPIPPAWCFLLMISWT